jgi:hypothetical protein
MLTLRDSNTGFAILEFDHELSGNPYGSLSESPEIFKGKRHQYRLSYACSSLQTALEDQKKEIVTRLVEMDITRPNKNGDEWFPSKIDTLTRILKISVTPVIDEPGFKMGWHTDNRGKFCAGVFNIEENPSPTGFCLRTPKALEYLDKINYTIPKNKNSGALWLNTNSAFHKVLPCETERKIILIQFSLF